MASHVPSKLKTANIERFALRAAQLEKLKPPIAYWCYYWITNQILAKSLHQADDECMQYTTTLVDKLESMKTQYATDDAIIDDVAGQAYVEQFGLDTFARADNAVRANKATKQTADTFSAASTFLDLVQIWGPPSPEIASKVKYAKYHAIRIAKALKNGEDPNESNPEPAPVPSENAVVPLDATDPEVTSITGAYQQPSVEAVEENDRASAHELPATEAPLSREAEWNAASLPRPNGEVPPTPDAAADTSATAQVNDQQQTNDNPRQNSLGGGYFPEVPTPLDQHTAPPELPSAPNDTSDLIDIPSAASHDPSTGIVIQPPSAPSANDIDPRDFYNTNMDIDVPPSTAPSAPSIPPIQPLSQPPPSQAHSQAQPPPTSAPAPTPTRSLFAAPAPKKPLWSSSVASSRSQTPQPAPSTSQPPIPIPGSSTNPASAALSPSTGLGTILASTEVDDAAMAEAQKHARWAISALNFEDVPTAVKELRVALRALGGLP